MFFGVILQFPSWFGLQALRERDAGQTRTVENFIQGSIFGKQLALEGNNPNLAPLGPYSEF